MKKAYAKPVLWTQAFDLDDVITVSAIPEPGPKSLAVVADDFMDMMDDLFGGSGQKTLSRVGDAFESVTDTLKQTLTRAGDMFEDILDGFTTDDKTLHESGNAFEDTLDGFSTDGKTLHESGNAFEDTLDGFSTDDKTLSESGDTFEDVFDLGS